MIYRGILKFDWPTMTLLSGGGFNYGQESFGGEHSTWMKKRNGCQGDGTFMKGDSLEVKVFGQPQGLGHET